MRLVGCLSTLEDVQQTAIRSAFFTGLSYAQLAQQRGVPLLVPFTDGDEMPLEPLERIAHTAAAGAPVVEDIAGLERGDPDTPRSGYASRFHHDNEKAEPGYYAVTLDDYKVRAELTTYLDAQKAFVDLQQQRAAEEQEEAEQPQRPQQHDTTTRD